MKEDILDIIAEKRSTMSKGHRRVADYVTAHLDGASYMTASALGEAAGVSESTVVRFAASLDVGGYPAFLRRLEEAARHRLTAVQRVKIAETRFGGDIPGAVLSSDMEKIRDTMENLSREGFERAMDAIENAGNIYIMGLRSSSSLAQFLYYYFDIIYDGVKLVRSSGGSETFEQLMKISANDVVIAISFPRYSATIAKAAAFASEAGARVIAITDSLSSPVAEHAYETLTAKSDMASFADSLVAPLSIINAMIAAAADRNNERLSSTLDRLETVWNEYNVYGNK